MELDIHPNRGVGHVIFNMSKQEVRARLGLASELNALNRSADAAEQLRVVINMKPSSPVGAIARAESELRGTLARMTKQ